MSFKPRTSQSHPLRIAELSVGVRGGLVGITFCPGKCGESVSGPPWKRDLGTDLDAIRRWGAEVVVTLVEDHELDLLKVRQLGECVRELGMHWYHLPIVDLSAPDSLFDAEWARVGPELGTRLDIGGRVLVHCRGGVGRAGTVAAILLIAAGAEADDAIRRVREVRPGAIETSDQVEYVRAWRPASPARGGA